MQKVELSVEERRYLFGQGALGAALVNILINGAIGWAITHGLRTFPVWKLPGAAPDLLATAFGVTFGTCIAAKFAVRIDIARGKLAVPSASPASRKSERSLIPRSLLVRSVWLGVVSVPVFAIPVLLALYVAGSDALERGVFIALKAGFSAVQAALVTPYLMLAALSDMSRRADLK